jgi:hypothetical protein
MQMIITAGSLDWSGWVRGVLGAAISGGAGAVSVGFGTMIVDPEHFNVLNGGIYHLLAVIGICFTVSSIVSLAKFLQTHPVPDYQQLKQAESSGFVRGVQAVTDAVISGNVSNPKV